MRVKRLHKIIAQFVLTRFGLVRFVLMISAAGGRHNDESFEITQRRQIIRKLSQQ